MKKEVQTTKSGYPLMRYLSLLLVVALLFSGVTFARFALERRGSIDTGVALFDASYTVEGVNSLTFGNQSYWMNYSNQWYAQGEGSARTVRIGMQNKSDVKVRANVLHMEGPAEFWENIALQLVATADNSVAAGDPLTTQYVLADFLRVRNERDEDGNPYEHNHTYGAYRQWGKSGTFDTKFSDEFGQRGSIEETFSMSGGINKTKDESGNETFSGSVTAVRQGTSATTNDFTQMPLTITITASMKMVQYSVGFARRQDRQTLPAFYLDCEKEVPYYSIDITLPDTDYFTMDAKKTTVDENGDPEDVIDTTSVIAFLTWTNSSGSDDLSTPVSQDDWSTIAPVPEDDTEGGTQGGTFNDATVTGYHFNYTDVPATKQHVNEDGSKVEESISTTVRMNYSYANGGITSWEHVASISSGDGVYAHDIVDSNGNIVILGTVPADSEEKMVEIANDSTYQCSGENPVTITASDLLLCNSSYEPAEFEVVQDSSGNYYSTATEKGYEVRFSVSFVQASEQPGTP